MRLIKQEKAKFRVSVLDVQTGKVKGFSVANHNIITLEELKNRIEKFVETIK